MEKRLFTSESVTEGHPDKVCDAISDAILDACMEKDPMSRVACETATCTGFVLVTGEITTNAYVDIQKIVRDTVKEIGYDSADAGFNGNTCAVIRNGYNSILIFKVYTDSNIRILITVLDSIIHKIDYDLYDKVRICHNGDYLVIHINDDISLWVSAFGVSDSLLNNVIKYLYRDIELHSAVLNSCSV